jgi:hypothetical protein
MTLHLLAIPALLGSASFGIWCLREAMRSGPFRR